MHCLSCFSEIDDVYSLYWYPTTFCHKCSLCATDRDFSEIIYHLINRFCASRGFVKKHTTKTLLKKFNFENSINYKCFMCHSLCNVASNGMCKVYVFKIDNQNFFYCPIKNITMFNPTALEKIVKNQIQKSSSKRLYLKRVLLALKEKFSNAN